MKQISTGYFEQRATQFKNQAGETEPRMSEFAGADDEGEIEEFKGCCPYCGATMKDLAEVEEHIDCDCDEYANLLDFNERMSRDD